MFTSIDEPRDGELRLATMAKAQASTTPLALNHTGLFPSVTVSFNLAPGVSLSDATLAIQQMQERLGTPSTVHGFFAGTLQAYQQSLAPSRSDSDGSAGGVYRAGDSV